jgi:peroxin-3
MNMLPTLSLHRFQVPTLSEQVLQDMDVDTLTRELQALSKARTSRRLPAQPTSRPPSTIVEVAAYPPAPYPPIALHDVDADARSDVDSVAHSSETGSRTSETDERYAHTAPSSRSVHQTATSASFISETTSVTRSWVVDVDTAERRRSPVAFAIFTIPCWEFCLETDEVLDRVNTIREI